VFIRFKKGVKDYKIWDPKDKKCILRRDVMFDEASMVKPTNSQQVESQTTNRILQQVESDATSPSLERPISFEITSSVTQGDDQIAEQDVDNDEDKEQAMGNVQESIAVGITQRNLRKPSWLTTNMIMYYALQVIEEAIRSTHREAEISSESKM